MNLRQSSFIALLFSTLTMGCLADGEALPAREQAGVAPKITAGDVIQIDSTNLKGFHSYPSKDCDMDVRIMSYTTLIKLDLNPEKLPIRELWLPVTTSVELSAFEATRYLQNKLDHIREAEEALKAGMPVPAEQGDYNCLTLKARIRNRVLDLNAWLNDIKAHNLESAGTHCREKYLVATLDDVYFSGEGQARKPMYTAHVKQSVRAVSCP